MPDKNKFNQLGTDEQSDDFAPKQESKAVNEEKKKKDGKQSNTIIQ